MSKHEWRKKEKEFYLPKNRPEVIAIPSFQFITLNGQGNPNSLFFVQCVQALYAVAYAIKMTLKKMKIKPVDYYDYTVYPLEGVWDITEQAKLKNPATFSKDDLVFNLMIRQPEFIDSDFFREMIGLVMSKKPNELIPEIKFEKIKEGKCIQMLHIGSFDDEPESFRIMENFAKNQGHQRESKDHREIYLSDFNKVAPENLKTVLRFRCIS